MEQQTMRVFMHGVTWVMRITTLRETPLGNVCRYDVVGVVDRSGNEVPPWEDDRLENVGGIHPVWKLGDGLMPSTGIGEDPTKS